MTAIASKRTRTALVAYPGSQSYILESLKPTLAKHNFDIYKTQSNQQPDLIWSDYDLIEWDKLSSNSLANSYLIRKALIRKNHLSHTLSVFISKNPHSSLAKSNLQTFNFSLSFPDELDELLQDDLYQLDESFQDLDQDKWWILKPAMADKGQGIRLFNTREALERIFEEFEIDSDEEDDDEEASQSLTDDTRVNASQMREWVIQEYVSSPLLLSSPTASEPPRKFHLRVYVLAVGALKVYVHHPFLALFAPVPYRHPSQSTKQKPSTLESPGSSLSSHKIKDDDNEENDDEEDGHHIDMSPHLTNTCLQTSSTRNGVSGEIVVETFQSLENWTINSSNGEGEPLGPERVKLVEEKVCEVVKETFKAGLGAGSGFQPLPNCFEIFGIDILLDEEFNASLLEINACPDFTQTGPALQSVIDHLFAETVRVAVVPFFEIEGLDAELEKLEIGEENGNGEWDGVGLRKVLEVQVSRAW
ncbi:TTL-domain-containing protein [Meredithblackwellia eburnea MCA 4105]